MKELDKIEAARSLGADRASLDKAPDPPEDFTPEQRIAYLEAFEGAANDWAEALRDRAADADGMRSAIEREKEKPAKRGEPNISRDWYDHAYVVIDDEGDAVGNVHLRIDEAKKYRELKGCPRVPHRHGRREGARRRARSGERPATDAHAGEGLPGRPGR